MSTDAPPQTVRANGGTQPWRRRRAQPMIAAAASTAPEDLFRDWRRDRDPHVREHLIERFAPLARSLARRYISRNEPIEDLVQVAMVGLIGAVDRFDPERGSTFASFAVPTILGELKRHFRDTGWAVHVPRGLKELTLRIDRASVQLSERTGRSPGVQELARHLDIPVEDVLAGLETHQAHYSDSLNVPLSAEDDAMMLVDTLGREEHGYGVVETRLSLSEEIRHLPYLEAQVLRMRMTEDLRQVEIARRLGCSQMQVSRLLRRGVARLRAGIDG